MSQSGQPATTAMLIAAAECLDARRAGRDDTAARLAKACLHGCGVAGTWLLRCIASGFGRGLLAWAERIALPGISAHYRWRKRGITAWVDTAIADGARQIIVLGAGFDALALKLRLQHPRLRAFEIERASTIAVKREALQRIGCGGYAPDLLACDLARQSPAKALLQAPGFDRKTSTVVIAEGLLMYLPATVVTRLCHILGKTLQRPSWLVATVMDAAGNGEPRFHRQPRWLSTWLQRRGEPFAWGATRAGLTELARECQVSLIEVADPDDPADPDPCPGEWLFRGVFRPSRMPMPQFGGEPLVSP